MNEAAHALGEGSFVFRQMTPGMLAVCIAAVAVFVGAIYALQLGGHRRFAKAASYALRTAVLVAILLVLCEPVLRKEEVIPQQSFLVHVFDTSGSMGIADYEKKPRIDILNAATLDSDTRRELDRLYGPLEFAFDGQLTAHKTHEPLAASENLTDLASAFRGVKTQIAGLPVSGAVLYSDGNPTVNGRTEEIVEAATALEVPVYCVGSGPKVSGPDVWIDKVVHPEQAVKGAVATVNVLVGTRGIPGKVTVTLRDAERQLDERELSSSVKEQVTSAAFQVHADELGVNGYHVTVATAGEESYPWNNEADFFMATVEERQRILYVEGYPRYEYRSLRAAFEDDERFQVTSLVLVGSQSKTYRQGLSDPNELRSGFPDTEEELFKYDVVVIGDVSAGYFKTVQLMALREFVRKKGGGLLFLGGENSFAADGFGRTPLADVLPFAVSSHARLEDEQFVLPTPEGIERGIFGPYDPQHAEDAPWEALPPLKGVYTLNSLKPGAVVLCRVEQGLGEGDAPVVAFQRYGRGTSLICGISGTWQWKFQVPSDNPSYSAFWKEMTLILLEQSAGRIQVKATPSQVSLGSEVAVGVSVYDRTFQPDPMATVTVDVETPSGETHTVPAHQTADTPAGTFQYSLTPAETGLYHVTARSQTVGDEKPLEHRCMFVVREDQPELRDVKLNEALLTRVAEATHGRYVHLSEYEHLPQAIEPREGSLRHVTEKPIWDRPAILYGLLGLLIGEWLIRRIGNMA
ncbi:MAG: hypothetical protein IT365_11510 [Candidatus Hydrogenedentes bacterium]|nr:hypothetical protein [Candidatus Hydrogenedentota bacterium]